MSPEEVQERLNAEDLSRPIVPVKPKTKKKEPTKKKLELVSPPHTYRRTVEERDDGRRSNPLPQKKVIRKMNFQCHRKEASQHALVRKTRPDRVETALKVLSTMSPAEVQERLNAEDLSTPILSVKPKTQ